MHFIKTCRLTDGNVDGSSSFLAISNDFTSAFDPGCKVWPVIGAVGAWELPVIYKDINRTVMGEPCEMVCDPHEQLEVVNFARNCWLIITFSTSQCRVCWRLPRHLTRTYVGPLPYLTSIIHPQWIGYVFRGLEPLVNLMNEGQGLVEVVEIKRMCNIPWFPGWLVCFSLEIKGIFLYIKILSAAICRGGIP